MTTSEKGKHDDETFDQTLLGSKTSPQDDSKSVSSILTEEDVSDTGRHHWSKKAEYILAAVGYCVGLGNIWRFPYVCMRNGGGAFLIPFFLSLFICAMPVYFLESAMGQFNGKSSLHVWSMVPLFKGLGISMNILTFFCSWYYSIILAWSLIYLAYSFSTPLPWTMCGQPWNTENCFIGIVHKSNVSVGSNDTLSGFDPMVSNISDFLGGNSSDTVGNTNGSEIISDWVNNSTNVTRVSAAEEFWLHKVLERSSGLEDMGGLPWHTGLALVVANLVVLVGVVKGIRSTGKVLLFVKHANLPSLLYSCC